MPIRTDPEGLRLPIKLDSTSNGEFGINYLVINRVLGDDGVVKLTHDDYGIQPFGE